MFEFSFSMVDSPFIEIASVISFYILVNYIFKWEVNKKYLYFSLPMAIILGITEGYGLNNSDTMLGVVSVLSALFMTFLINLMGIIFTSGKIWKRIIVALIAMEMAGDLILYSVKIVETLEMDLAPKAITITLKIIAAFVGVFLMWVATLPGRKVNNPRINLGPIVISFVIFEAIAMLFELFIIGIDEQGAIKPLFGLELSKESMGALVQGYNFLTAILIVGIVFISIYGLNFYITQRYYKKTAQRNASFLEIQTKYYESLEKSSKEIKSIRHDYKNHLTVLSLLLENGEVDKAKEYIYDIGDSLNSTKQLSNTGNAIADAIISDKITKAKKFGITIKVNGVFSYDGMKAIDVCTILGNILDNAIEALCGDIVSNKEINLEFQRTENFFMVSSSNSCAKPLNYDGNQIVTSKADKSMHGLGIQNIKNSTEVYNGDMKISCKKDKDREYIFRIDLMFPIN